MIKIYLADNYKIGEPSTVYDDLFEKPDLFEKYGVKVVDKIKECDIIIASRTDCYFKHCKKPVILCEKYDSSCIGTSFHYYSDPNVIAVFKNFMPRDPQILMHDTLHKRYHYHLLSNMYKTDEKPEEINNETKNYLHKFRQVTWFLPYTHLPSNKHMQIFQNTTGQIDKDIDIFCVFHKHSGILADHRKKIKETIEKMTDLTIVTGSDLDQNDYNLTLLRSKICIAPWGLGERIALDQKGILAKCIVLKPDTDFVQFFPDMYDEKYYVKFKLDLSDLEEKCREVLKNYSKYMERTIAASKLFQTAKYENYVEKFCQAIKEVRDS